MQQQLRRWILLTFALGVVSLALSFGRDRNAATPAALRYGAVAAAIVLIVFRARTAVRFQRALDEMQRRNFLEITSVVGIAAIAWLYLFPVLEKTGFVGALTHDGYALVVAPLCLIAWFAVVRRYR
jgi:low temperature requirement protein LtrA